MKRFFNFHMNNRNNCYSLKIPLLVLDTQSNAPIIKKEILNPTKDDLLKWYGRDEINWLIGFIDAEGCFLIETSLKQIRHYFQLRLHADHLITLKWINSYFFCNKGTITYDKSNNAYTLKLRSVNAQWTYLIAILDNFPLNTTKYLNYLDFKKVAIMIQEGFHKKNHGKDLIREIKNNMNTKRTNYNMTITKEITPSWLIGFIEGDGTFTFENIYPRMLISLNKKDSSTLEAIKNYLEAGNINILGKDPKYKGMLKFKVGRLKDLINIIDILNLGNWHTLKHYDYTHWVLMVMLHNNGYHKHAEFRSILENVFKTMNNNKKEKTVVVDYKKIMAMVKSEVIIKEYILELSKLNNKNNEIY